MTASITQPADPDRTFFFFPFFFPPLDTKDDVSSALLVLNSPPHRRWICMSLLAATGRRDLGPHREMQTDARTVDAVRRIFIFLFFDIATS
jgi:hypothetical protein